MDNPTSLKQLFQGMQIEGMAMQEGTVLNVSPIKIKLKNDEKMILNSNNIIVSNSLRSNQLTGTIKIDGETTKSCIFTYGGLNLGDNVMLLAFNHGKKYFVLDRM